MLRTAESLLIMPVLKYRLRAIHIDSNGGKFEDSGYLFRLVQSLLGMQILQNQVKSPNINLKESICVGNVCYQVIQVC